MAYFAVMRFYVSGPRLFGGLVRPGFSFAASEIFSRSQTARRTDFVYVVEGDHGMVKVGSSVNPMSRRAALQTGSAHRLHIVKTIPAYGHAFAVEHEAHAILAAHHENGDWFSVSPNMAIAAVYGAADRLGIDMSGEETKTPSWRWPKSSIGQIFIVFVIIWALGMIIHGLGLG